MRCTAEIVSGIPNGIKMLFLWSLSVLQICTIINQNEISGVVPRRMVAGQQWGHRQKVKQENLEQKKIRRFWKEVFLYTEVAGTDICVRVNPRTTARVGDLVPLAIDRTKLHLFDKDTECA